MKPKPLSALSERIFPVCMYFSLLLACQAGNGVYLGGAVGITQRSSVRRLRYGGKCAHPSPRLRLSAGCPGHIVTYGDFTWGD
jgi:hypothetical protein